MRTIAAGEFKAKCLALMDEVKATGETVEITKRGQVVAWLVPPMEPAPKESPEAIFGCLRHMAAVTGDLVSSPYTDEEWERMFQEKWDRFDKASAK